MAPSLEFFFDYTCPYAYLASTRVRALAAHLDVPCTYRPMLLGGVFRARGTPQNLAGTLSPMKARHNQADLRRWAQLYERPLKTPAGHPLRSVDALRVTLACDCDPKVIDGFYSAYWAEGRDIGEESVLRSVVNASGRDPDAALARSKEPSIKDELRARTERAIELGVFGAPSFLKNGEELFFGQDRMHLVAGLEIEPFLAKIVGTAAAPRAERSRQTVEFFFDFSSPYAYLASRSADALAARSGAVLKCSPTFLGGLFKSLGQAEAPLLTWSEAKQKYTLKDLADCAKALGLPFAFPTKFPIVTVKPLRVLMSLPEERRDRFRDDVFRAYWAEGRDISSDDVLREIIGEGATEALDRAKTQEIKDALLASTTRAEARGVFGVPTFMIEDEVFWGHDRLPLVERALSIRA